MSNNEFKRDRVAIIGIGMTLPGGANDQDSFWQLMEQKRDATIDIPKDRWDSRHFYSPYGSEKPGKMYVTRGGFLPGNVSEFDPLFFGISPREACIMDFQQRLLLEVAAKTFQDAGFTAKDYASASVGVFIGGFCMDAHVQSTSFDSRNWYITQSVTGSSATLLSNRISYVFDLKGPSLTVDTACSSSLVAAHYAVESILSGDCDTALVGGVNVMTQPEHFIEMCKSKLLSKDGKCFTWDERANGYCRGEGAGMLLLKSLSAAQRDGDHIYAVIEGTGVNQDGTTKGITSPNADAQAELIKRVLKKAELKPVDIDYVEAHGTGTQAGDKAETSALNSVFAQDREDKLVIGSVKTNIGHLEAAAGVSGLLKAILCLKNGKIPANLNFETPNPEIPFDTMCLKVPTETQDWPRQNKTKYIGVNGFGYGGTNAHIILGEAPKSQQSIVDSDDANFSAPLLLPLSAKSSDSLKALAVQYKNFLDAGDVTTPQFLRRVSTKRNHYDRRALIFAANKQELLERLELFSKNTPAVGIVSAEPANSPGELTFVYSGMGPQWWGMGQELLVTEPLFAQKMKEYDQVFQKIAGWSLLEEMQSSEENSRVAKTDVAQPMNFAVQAALTELWRSWGIEPAAVVGHSVGEVTSAYVSGILSLEDALLVSYHRSRLQGTLANTGGMLAVGLSEKAIQVYLSDYSEHVSIAAVNSPHAVTLAGQQEALDQLAEIFQEANIFNRALQVEVPYHSPLMAPIEAEIKERLAGVKPQPAKIPCYSTVSGELATATDYDADYWWHNVRESVQFAKTIETLCENDFHSFLEVGPHPVLNSSMKEILSEKGIDGQVYSSLNRKTPEQATLLNSLGLLYAQGYDLDWNKIQTAQDCYFQLPTYPWQKSSYTYGSPKFYQDKFGEQGHPILYRNLHLPYPAWEVELSDAFFPYVKDHKIGNKIILPGAFYVEAALALNEKISGERVSCLKNLSFERIMALPDEKSEEEKRIISMCTADKKLFSIYSTTTALQETWAFHMRGEIAPALVADVNQEVLRQSWDDFQNQDIDAFYKTVAENGLQYGPYFQPIKTLKNKDGVVYAELENTLADISNDYILSPAILDGVFQTLFAFGGQYKVPFIPVQIERLAIFGAVTTHCKVVGNLQWMSAKSLKADFVLYDQDNQPIAELKGVVCQALAQMGVDQKDVALYRTSWELVDTDEVDTQELTNETLVIISNNPAEIVSLHDQLSEKNKVIFIEKNNYARDEFAEILTSNSVSKVIYLCEAPVALDKALAHSVSHCARLTEMVQVFSEINKPVELFIGTRQACKVLDSDRVEGVASSSLSGFARTINTEYSTIKCSSVDFTSANQQELQNFHDFILCAEAGAKEVAIRGTRIYQHTLVTLEQEEKEIETVDSRIGQAVTVLDFSSVENNPLPFAAKNRVLPEGSVVSDENLVALQSNEIELEVNYLTLSYWDQLNSQLAIYPEDPEKHFFKYQVGTQCVGEVVNKGSAVKDFSIGDQVLSLYPHGITNFTTLNAKYAFILPEQLRHGNLPDIYEIFRARFALSTIGNLREGASIVIKGSWGAFVQTLLEDSKAAGLTAIFVDEQASSLVEYDVAAIPGVHYVAGVNSNWADDVSRITTGVDIFINHGWKDLENLQMLNAFSKVVDFKSNQIARNHVSAIPALNATYHVIDVDSLFSLHFDFVKVEIEKILLSLASETLSLPALPVFDLNNIAAAAVELKSGVAAAVHVSMNQETVPLLVETKAEQLALDGTYIVSGGTQGFGLQCAQWLVEKGALNLVLISRSGLRDLDAVKTVAELEQQGINVKVCALDVTNLDLVKEEFTRIKNTMPPVKGIIHSAMVLDDAYLSQLDAARFQRVMSPKIQGAINLHLALQETALDFFVMFSSISSLIGNAGQGNYVAANSFLDGFAHYLSSRGVAAKTINWGALSDTGVLAHNENLVKVLELAGIYGVTNLQAMKAMESVILGDASQTGIFHVDWNQWAISNPSLSQSNFYRELLTQQDQSAERQKLMEILENIINKDSEERRAYIQQELAIRFGAIFKMSPESISPHASIIDLGVDSLMSVEISMALKTQLGVDIPTIELISGPSISTLATKILTQIEALIEEVLREQAEADEPTALEM